MFEAQWTRCMDGEPEGCGNGQVDEAWELIGLFHTRGEAEMSIRRQVRLMSTGRWEDGELRVSATARFRVVALEE